MAHNFGTLAFTPAVKALQERYGSLRQYERLSSGSSPDMIGRDEASYLAERDSFYMATVSSTGWPYVQHRGGPKGFLKVLDNRTLAFADFRGNKQYVSTGNLATDDRVALILIDYPHQARLKILGHVEVLEGEAGSALQPRLTEPGYKAVVERVYKIHVEAIDWNCQQHITPRFTEDEVRDAIAPLHMRIQELETEIKRLREKAGA